MRSFLHYDDTIIIQLLENPILPSSSPALVITKWRYLGNQEWNKRSTGVKTIGEKNIKLSEKCFEKKFKQILTKNSQRKIEGRSKGGAEGAK